MATAAVGPEGAHPIPEARAKRDDKRTEAAEDECSRNEQGRFRYSGAYLFAQMQQRHEVVAMINASQIKEHMEVKGSDGKHVGTVLGVESGQVKIASGGMDHCIDIAAIEAVEGDRVTLRKTAGETLRTWH